MLLTTSRIPETDLISDILLSSRAHFWKMGKTRIDDEGGKPGRGLQSSNSDPACQFARQPTHSLSRLRRHGREIGVEHVGHALPATVRLLLPDLQVLAF